MKYALANAAIPIIPIIKPVILLIHHNCFNPNFLLKRFTIHVSENHQVIPPNNTPIRRKIVEIILCCSEVLLPPQAAMNPINRNIANGLDNVRKNTEIKSSKRELFLRLFFLN